MAECLSVVERTVRRFPFRRLQLGQIRKGEVTVWRQCVQRVKNGCNQSMLDDVLYYYYVIIFYQIINNNVDNNNI